MFDRVGTQGANETYEWWLIFTCADDQNPLWVYFLLSSWYTLLHEIRISSSHNCSLEHTGIYCWLEYFLSSFKKSHWKKSVQSRENQRDQQVTLKVLTSCRQLLWQGLTIPTKNAKKMYLQVIHMTSQWTSAYCSVQLAPSAQSFFCYSHVLFFTEKKAQRHHLLISSKTLFRFFMS